MIARLVREADTSGALLMSPPIGLFLIVTPSQRTAAVIESLSKPSPSTAAQPASRRGCNTGADKHGLSGAHTGPNAAADAGTNAIPHLGAHPGPDASSHSLAHIRAHSGADGNPLSQLRVKKLPWDRFRRHDWRMGRAGQAWGRGDAASDGVDGPGLATQHETFCLCLGRLFTIARSCYRSPTCSSLP